MKPRSFGVDPFSSLDAWTFEPVFREKTQIEEVDIFLCGMQAHHPKWGGVVGSSANHGAYPENSAWYELVERIAILKAIQEKQLFLRDPQSEKIIGTIDGTKAFPSTFSDEAQYAKSNGVALFNAWPEACRRATLELVERHLILASWIGYHKPERITQVPQTELSRLERIYRVEHYNLGTQRVSSLAAPVAVTAVVLWPKDPKHPLIYAFGGGETRAESIVKAETETWQRLGFLWGEELPQSEPEFAPNQLYHQELYLFTKQHGRIESWLSGAFFNPKLPALAPLLSMKFIDLSSDQTLHFKVAKAIAEEAIPLVFGKWRGGVFAGIDADRLIHPIA
ncbi:MAG: YcaO-like family protein [Chitinophagaceae bacterium]|nr:YcaO-like family protein [Oligoflexus sp.]